MTGDELAARLFAEQGFFVAASYTPLEIGTVPPWGPNQYLRIHAPCRVVAEATEAEFDAQYRRAEEISGKLGGLLRLPYYYRVEAAD